jgi:hypothetical protein
MDKKNLWSGPERFDEQELEDLAVIQNLTLVYGLGIFESEKKIKFVHDWFETDMMSISDAVVFLRSFEQRYRDEVWFRPSVYESRKAIVARRVQGSAGAGGPEDGSVHGPDNERAGGEGH